ncbi:MAG TPA: hypothetical protein VIY52_31745 [Streptosporangiaceae bacterium]
MYCHDARPADLISDTDSDSAPLAAAPPGSEGRLTFRASGLVVEVEIAGTGDARRLTGQLAPRQSALVDVRSIITVEADELGRFSAEALPPGQLSLRCRLGAGTDRAQVTTGWVALRSQ